MSDQRILFRKDGTARYISHLDLMHTMQRAFNRAGLPLKYSEGFNPHPQIAIALPLSVGIGSLCEIMDFKLKGEADLKELPERLTAVMPEGIRVLEAYEPQRKVAELKWLHVEGFFAYDKRDPGEMEEALRHFFEQESIVITKKTKRGMGETDIRPGIREIRFTPGENEVDITAVLPAQEPTINPELLAEALRQLCPELAPDFARFTRVETYDAEMKIYR